MARARVPVVCEHVASRMTKHVRVNRELELGNFSCSGNHLGDRSVRQRPLSLCDEHVWRLWIVAFQASQGSNLRAANRMD
jgi:hypothetical protein